MKKISRKFLPEWFLPLAFYGKTAKKSNRKIFFQRFFNALFFITVISILSIACGGGSGGGSGSGGGGSDTTPPTVSQFVPAEGATDVAINSAIAIHFSENVVNVSAQAADGVCVQNIQLSSDNFSNCVGGAIAGSGREYTFTPGANLAATTTYRVRVIGGAGGITDTAGNVLAETYTQATGFTTGVAADTTPPTVNNWSAPADGATGFSPTGVISVTFSEPVQNLTIQGEAGTCSATFQISSDNFVNCIAGNISSASNTYTFTPIVPLLPNTTYRVRIKGGAGNVADLAGNVLVADVSMATGFTTSSDTTPPVTGTAISFGTITGTSVVVNWGAATDAVTPENQLQYKLVRASAIASIDTVAEANGVGPTLVMDWTTNQLTATASGLAGATTYYFAVLVRDGSGNMALYVPVSATTLDETPPANVTGHSTTVRLQSVGFNWTNPVDSDFSVTRVYYRCHSGETACSVASYTQGCSGSAGASAADSCTISGLVPGKKYDFSIRTRDTTGNESTGVTIDNSGTGVETVFSGSVADFTAGQTREGLGAKFYFTWNDTHFFAGVTSTADTNLLGTNDALWIGFDTDSPDNDGEKVTNTDIPGNGKIHWPFLVDFIAEFKVTGVGSTSAGRKEVGGAGWTGLSGALMYEGAMDQLSFPKSQIGNPVQARIAMIAVNTSTGYTYGLLPDNSTNATDTTGLKASLTGGINPANKIFDVAYMAASASEATSPSYTMSALVTFTLNHTPGKTNMKIKGSLAPLSYTLSDSVYTLQEISAGVYTGKFNIGQTGELFFKFNDNDSDEPVFSASGVDRVYAVNTASATLPALTWNTVYSATNSFTVYWGVNNCVSAETQIRGNTLPLVWVSGDFLAKTGDYCSGSTVFTNQNFVTEPLQFKAMYPIDNWEGTCTGGINGDRTVNDDIINARVLEFSFNNVMGGCLW